MGKTYILQKFGDQFFDKAHYFNFERSPELHRIFAHNLEPIKFITDLEFYLNQTIHIEKDLIIFDEIQECPSALTIMSANNLQIDNQHKIHKYPLYLAYKFPLIQSPSS